jgi:hypothetical protein
MGLSEHLQQDRSNLLQRWNLPDWPGVRFWKWIRSHLDKVLRTSGPICIETAALRPQLTRGVMMIALETRNEELVVSRLTLFVADID